MNLDNLHTTKLGAMRIKKNLRLNDVDVVEFCKNKIKKENCKVYKREKNWYCEFDNMLITVNSYSYTLITAHII